MVPCSSRGEKVGGMCVCVGGGIKGVRAEGGRVLTAKICVVEERVVELLLICGRQGRHFLGFVVVAFLCMVRIVSYSQ